MWVGSWYRKDTQTSVLKHTVIGGPAETLTATGFQIPGSAEGEPGLPQGSQPARAFRQAGEQVTASARTALKVLRQFAQTSLFMCHRSTGLGQHARPHTRERVVETCFASHAQWLKARKRIASLRAWARLADFPVVAMRACGCEE